MLLTPWLYIGIVTHLDQKTYEMGKVWGGTVIYSANYSEDFMAAMADYQQDGQLDTKSAILPYLAVTNDTILSTMVYLDDVEKPDAFAPFYDIPSVQDGTQIYDNFHQFAESALPELPRQVSLRKHNRPRPLTTYPILGGHSALPPCCWIRSPMSDSFLSYPSSLSAFKASTAARWR